MGHIFSDSNFYIFLFSLLPGLIYSFVVFLNTPYDSIRLNKSIIYLFSGFISSFLVIIFHKLFPGWKELLFLDYHIPTLLTVFAQAFIQIALVEELAKFISFSALDKIDGREESPIATMFNFMIVGTGFAIVENAMYGLNYGGQVLLTRSITALVVHMTLGIMIGYFVALGKQNTEISDKTNFHIFLKMNPRWKRIIYSVTGLIIAIFFHGMYDLNLSFRHINQEIYSLIILAISIYVSWNMGKDLLRIHNKNNKRIRKKMKQI
jgi:RsiW-degrading membrane proteinase PrsW (M82 family)